ncbi:helix-turn-helix transcriptional regulator [Polaribacter batillariae]|uniref:Helix-turn-helix transcriptional regulator n=1 Tax=Polaribacter batillariae TaxID=2808900 RepID=A0ABX7SXJ9_9FLAO|nr:helix-turn-helix transcriptional regulator [Polaribacter batillariae]QTD38434.1 helix-turn-helix transcriptional regulator [Polaribacter batillariae]
MDKTKKVREKIRMLRLQKEYTQENIGDFLGIGQVAYYKLESGKTQLKVETLIKLANILEVTPSYLLEGVS